MRIVQRAVINAREKAERAFRADHQMGQDIDRIVEIDQGVDGIAGGVLEPVFSFDPGHRVGVGAGVGRKRRQSVQQRLVRGAEAFHALRLRRVEPGAVGQHQPHGSHGVVRIAADATTHARGVIGRYAADLAGVDRGRIGADLAAEKRQLAIGVAADHRRPEPHNGGGGIIGETAKAFAETDQHRIRDRLPGQGGAGGAKGHRRALFAAKCENGGDFVFVFHRRDDARRQPVKTGVGSIGEQSQGIGDDPRRRQDGRQVALQQGIIDFFARHGAAPFRVTPSRAPEWLPS